MKVVELSESAIKKIVKAFNTYGPDGLVAGRRTGRKRLIAGDMKERDHRGVRGAKAVLKRTFWTACAFHGHITEKYSLDCSYQTVLRLLHEKGYVLKVPRPWPDRQDEAVREAFLTHLRTLAEDPGIELWYGDETGIDGELKTPEEMGHEGITTEGRPQRRPYPPLHPWHRLPPDG